MKPPAPRSEWIVLILALGVATALNLITFAVLYDAIFSQGPGLSENATQILTGWGGGMIGVIGAYVGYKVGVTANGQKPPDEGSSMSADRTETR